MKIKPSMPKICPRSLTIISVVSIAVLLFIYIMQVNRLAETRFEVSTYKKEITRLFQENKNSEIYYSQKNSLASLDSLLENSNYIRIDKVHYIQMLEDTIAVK